MGRKTKMNVVEASRIIHKTPQYVRWGLQQQRLPFGSAVKNPLTGRWSYNIIESKVLEYAGNVAE